MTLKTVQAIRHIGFEDLGSFALPLRAAGYDIEYVDVAERDAAQLDPLAADLLVVLGGDPDDEACTIPGRLAIPPRINPPSSAPAC